ncbi:MAG: FliI/YscN family ATPase [Phycisphaerales bacterium]
MSAVSWAFDAVERVQPLGVTGSVAALKGLTVLVDDLPLAVGSFVRIGEGEGSRAGEVVGFDGERAIVMLLGSTAGIRAGEPVRGEQSAGVVRAGRGLLGRVVNALCEPIDGKGPIGNVSPTALLPAPIGPMQRRRIKEPLPTGVRAVDLMTTVGKGQRVGVFAGPGVGKSTLLGTIAKRTRADVSVIALVGERGREVRDFVEASLGEEGLARSVVVVATSDESPLMRIRAALAAAAVAERFRDDGADVMLMMDSVTRLAQAQRQVGLSVGEPPATKGYTPSVFAMMPVLLERAGAVEGGGSVTGFYTILVEGDDMTEPVSDAARGILDGHIVLSRKLAHRGHYPAIDVLDSVSRVADEVCDPGHTAARRQLQRLVAAHREVEELVQIGAYARGSNPVADVAIALKGKIDALLQQGSGDVESFEDARKRLVALAVEAGGMLQKAR